MRSGATLVIVIPGENAGPARTEEWLATPCKQVEMFRPKPGWHIRSR